MDTEPQPDRAAQLLSYSCPTSYPQGAMHPSLCGGKFGVVESPAMETGLVVTCHRGRGGVGLGLTVRVTCHNRPAGLAPQPHHVVIREISLGLKPSSRIRASIITIYGQYS